MMASKTTLSEPAIAKVMLHAVMLWGMVTAIVVALGIDTSGWWLVPLFGGSAIAGLLVWRGYRWPDGWSKYIGFGGAVLLALIANRFLYVADVYLSGERFREWPFLAIDPAWAVLKGEAVTMAGTLITVGVWVAAGGAQYSPNLNNLVSRSALGRLLVVSYALSLIGSSLLWMNREEAAVLGQLLPVLHGLGIACCFLLPVVLSQNRVIAIFSAGVLSSPYFYFSLDLGMKEEIIVAMLPGGYLLWNATRSMVAKVTVVLVGSLFISIITPFVGYYREQVWYGERDLSAVQAIGEFSSDVRYQGAVDTAASGLEAFVRRNNASLHRGWAISFADNFGYEPQLVFAPLTYVFIPRLLWPEKPLIQQGWEYSGLLFGQDFTRSSTTSTAAGLYAAFYLGYGWPAVLAGAALIGLLVAWLQNMAWRVGGVSLAGMYSFSLLPFALRLDETWTVGAISGPIISLVYLILLYGLARVISVLVKA